MKGSTVFDAIVVGAGPAGVSSVIDLVRGGARVALVERSEFPRRKACAGAISISSLRLLRYDVTPVTREFVREMRLSLRFGRPVLARASSPVVAMTRRSEFDALGLAEALATGCEFFIQSEMFGIEQDDRGVTVRYPGFALRGRYLIAADGVSSTVRRLVGGVSPRHALSIEAEVDKQDVKIDVCHSTRVDFGVVRGGGGWVFPKGDHYNVGLYTYDSRHAGVINRRYLADYAKRVIGVERLADFQGFPIGIGCRPEVMSKGRVLFVGDAAGFSYTHSGEGIYGAVLSGQLAAASVLAGDDVSGQYVARASRYLRRCAIIHGLSGPLYGTLPVSYSLLAHRLSRQVASAGSFEFSEVD